MKNHRYAIFFLSLFVIVGWAQVSELSLASQMATRNRWGSALDFQKKAFQLSVSNFLSQVITVLPLPLGMARVGITNSFSLICSGDFIDYEYRIAAMVSNENFVSTITWLYSMSQNERTYNLIKSLPYLKQNTLWWQSKTNQNQIYFLFKEKNTYHYLRVIQEKDNTFEKGFSISIEIIPIKKLPPQSIDDFVWDYIMKSDWRDVERLLR